MPKKTITIPTPKQQAQDVIEVSKEATSMKLADPTCDRELTAAERRLLTSVPHKVGYVHHERFEDNHRDNRDLHLDQLPLPPAKPIDLAAYDRDHPVKPPRAVILKPDQEALLFLAYNHAWHRLDKLIPPRRNHSAQRQRRILYWYQSAMIIREKLVYVNMPLVLAMAKRMQIPHVEFTDLTSEGYMALLRSVDKFDMSRGFKFSTYACRAILSSFKRLAAKSNRYRQRFPAEFDPELERGDARLLKYDLQWRESADAIRDILAGRRGNLSELERQVVTMRFSIISRGKMRTLSEVARRVGLSHERVRQVLNAAIQKIHLALCREYLPA